MKRLIFGIVLALMTSGLQAQTSKPVDLADNSPYTDNIVIKNPAGDINVTAKFVFSEANNTITVTLQGDKKLFVFWDEIAYKKAFKRRHLRTDLLSYSMTVNTTDVFRRAKRFHHSLPKPRRKYHFHAWAKADSLQPLPVDRKMVCDSISQTYSIDIATTNPSIRLRDILLLDEVKEKGIAHYYDLSFGTDVNTVYAFTVKRNPCYGKDEQIQAADSSLSAIIRSYRTFKRLYDGGVVNSEKGEQMFLELQSAIQTQFPAYTDSSACPAIQDAHTKYNQYVDSIGGISVSIKATDGDEVDHPLNAKTIRANARTLDSNVARWIISTDDIEKSDLIQQCKDIILQTHDRIDKNGTRTQEERDAASVFYRAEQYFKRTCQ